MPSYNPTFAFGPQNILCPTPCKLCCISFCFYIYKCIHRCMSALISLLPLQLQYSAPSKESCSIPYCSCIQVLLLQNPRYRCHFITLKRDNNPWLQKATTMYRTFLAYIILSSIHNISHRTPSYNICTCTSHMYIKQSHY